MGIPAILAAAKPFAGAIAGGINAISSFFTNKAQKKTNLEMYDRQRADSLADWNMQNQYNSPAEQMKRYKEAGLSPHLIYGQTHTASPVRSTDAKTPNYVAPQLDTVNPFISKLQMENLQEDINLKKANALKTASDITNKNLQNDFLADTYGYRMDAIHSKNLLTSSQMRKTEEDITKTQGQIKLQQLNANKLIADTNLSEAKKAQAYQIIRNMITSQNLLRKKTVTEDFIQEVYAGKSNLQSAQTSKTRTDEYVAQELLQLKQLGVPLDVTKGALLMRQPTQINKTFNKY